MLKTLPNGYAASIKSLETLWPCNHQEDMYSEMPTSREGTVEISQPTTTFLRVVERATHDCHDKTVSAKEKTRYQTRLHKQVRRCAEGIYNELPGEGWAKTPLPAPILDNIQPGSSIPAIFD